MITQIFYAVSIARPECDAAKTSHAYAFSAAKAIRSYMTELVSPTCSIEPDSLFELDKTNALIEIEVQ